MSDPRPDRLSPPAASSTAPSDAAAATEPRQTTSHISVLIEQRQAWQRGERTPAEHYLQCHPSLFRDADAVRDLVVQELQLRLDRGEAPQLDDYLQRFPGMADEIKVHMELEAALALSGTLSAPSRGLAAAGLAAPIPGYDITGELGRGGMGVVCLARDHQFHRSLAIKLLGSEHKDDPDLKRRFLEEAQLMGQLTHPGIPPVHELGELPDGRPYFAMKLIKGKTLADLLQERDEPEQDHPRLLSIFEQICQTLAFAHAKGIIHRDLKPSNVMIGAFGEVQVMDWGLAKVLGGADKKEAEALPASAIWTVRSGLPDSATRAGQAMGTPSYMAPEQARGEAGQLDERCDVFGLGAILCEILTGHPAYRGRDVREVIAMAQLGQVEPALVRLEGSADAELVALASRCLAARKEARPAHAGAVLEGIQAYLRGVQERLRQVELAQAQAEVRTQEERKRRRLRLVLAASLLLLLAGLTIGTILLGEKNQALSNVNASLTTANAKLDVANASLTSTNADLDGANRSLTASNEKLDRAQKAAQKAADAEKHAADKERQANALAQTRLREIEKANGLLVSVFTDIDPRSEQKGGPLLVEQLANRLADAADKLDENAIGDPLSVARLQTFLGKTLTNLGHPTQAIKLLAKALATYKKQRGPDHPDIFFTMNNLALAYDADGQLAKALPLYEGALAKSKAQLGPDHPETLTTMTNLASAYVDNGQPAKAVPLHEEALLRRKAKLGPDHLDTLISMNFLALAYQKDGQLAKALPLLEETRAKFKAKLGPDHADTLAVMNNLALAYADSGQLAKALALHEEALRGRKAKLGPDHPDTLVSMNCLALAYYKDGRLAQALPLYEEALAKFKAKLGSDHPETLMTMNNLALAYLANGQLAKALPLHEEALAGRKAKLGPDHPETLVSMNCLALAYQRDGQLAKALPLFAEALPRLKAKLGPDHPETLISMDNLALAYFAAKEPGKGVPLFQEYLAVKRKQWGGSDPRYAGQLATFALDLLKYEQFAAAEPMLRECLAIRAQKEPDAWNTFNARALLGASLLGQKKYQDAGPLLKEGFEGMKARAQTIPPEGKARLTEALQRLVQLYEATGNASEAERWRKELAARQQAEKEAKK